MNTVKNEIERLGSIKVSFTLIEKFTRVNHETNEQQTIKHYFEGDQPTIFMWEDGEERIREKFKDFIRMVKGQTNNWSERGSGWVEGDIDLA